MLGTGPRAGPTAACRLQDVALQGLGLGLPFLALVTPVYPHSPPHPVLRAFRVSRRPWAIAPSFPVEETKLCVVCRTVGQRPPSSHGDGGRDVSFVRAPLAPMCRQTPPNIDTAVGGPLQLLSSG